MNPTLPSLATVIIIPVHNRRDLTLACLRRLRANGDLARHSVLLIDDGSTDGTGEAVAAEFPGVLVQRGDGNLWWTGAMALGMAEAFGRGAQAVVWLNDDCLPEPGAIDRLVAALAQAADVAGPTCLREDGGRDASGFSGRHQVSARAGESRPVEGLSGYCVAISRRAWEKVGAPDARRFPHYYGDTAYTLQASRAGLRVLLLGDAVVQLRDYTPPAATFPAGATWSQVFRDKKSRFRLPTQWHYLRLKYGAVRGSVLALGRTLAWQLRFLFGR